MHFVHLTALWHAKWTLCPYSVHFVHLTNLIALKWPKCTLIAADLLTSLPSRS